MIRDEWNSKTVYHTLWDRAKAVLTGECRAMNVYIKTQERSQINNLTLYFKKQEKAE